MKTRILYNQFMQVFLFVMIFSFGGFAQKVELKNNSFYIDGQKFFVKGIGYPQGEMPGILPWARPFDEEHLRFDMQRICDCGFNTIRTWSPLTAQELDVIKQYDLKIIMGIWIDPSEYFANPTVVNRAKKYVSDVLSYSKNYNNIIAYLIMNEPQPDVIARSGYDNFVALWSQLIDIIHAQHPYRPVSISGSTNETYINPNVFDFSAYNVYNYAPITVNYLHRYRDYIQYLNDLKHGDVPLIITEFGLSVSPSGPGKWGYGGNTLNEQMEGDLYMYKALVDGGAAGSCIFMYNDGWWKGGNEFVHDDHPEEWFGLVNYTSLSDKFGEERPVWKAVKAFQSAIITQPRSSEIYPAKVPVEIFPDKTIDRIEIMLDSQQVYQRQAVKGYLLDTLQFDIQDVKDAILVFNCYDAENKLVKQEEKSILVTTKDVVLPSIQISIANTNFWQDNFVDVNYQVNKSQVFNTSSRLDGVFYVHDFAGYEYKYVIPLSSNEQVNFTKHHDFNSKTIVFTLGAAFNVTYNGFTKRIVNQLTKSRINEIATSVNESLHGRSSLEVYPNPFTTSTTFTFRLEKSANVSIRVFDIFGRLVADPVKEFHQIGEQKVHWNTEGLPSGLYFCRLKAGNQFITHKIVKM